MSDIEPGNLQPRRTLLITGATGGIGLASAQAAHAAGWQLLLVARSPEVHELAQSFRAGPAAVAVQADSSELHTLQEAVRIGLDQFGAIDAAFVNAGISAGPRTYLPGGADTEPVEGWREMVLTNVLGTALSIRAVGEALRSSGGRLVITGSVLGRYAMPGSFYSATKFAVAGIAETARLEMLGTGVGVTLLEPGPVATPFAGNAATSLDHHAALGAADVARAVIYVLEQPDGVEINELLIRPHGATP